MAERRQAKDEADASDVGKNDEKGPHKQVEGLEPESTRTMVAEGSQNHNQKKQGNNEKDVLLSDWASLKGTITKTIKSFF